MFMLVFLSKSVIGVGILLELLLMGQIIRLEGGSSVKWFGWLRSFIVVVILEKLLFLKDVTCLKREVLITWFCFEADLVIKDIVNDGEGLDSNLEGSGIMIIINLG